VNEKGLFGPDPSMRGPRVPPKVAPKPLPQPKRKQPENLDRPLTKFEIIMWTRKTGGVKPGPGATLRHFRRGMGGGGWRSTD
jgi:hypothetical protein